MSEFTVLFRIVFAMAYSLQLELHCCEKELTDGKNGHG